MKASLEKIIEFINRTSYEGKEHLRHGIEEGLVSIASILNIAKNALSANQAAIQTVSHDVANVDTPGYSRQEAVLEEATTIPRRSASWGTALPSSKSRATSTRTSRTQSRPRTANLQETDDVYEQYLTSIQGIFNEDNSNLSASITTVLQRLAGLVDGPDEHRGQADRCLGRPEPEQPSSTACTATLPPCRRRRTAT